MVKSGDQTLRRNRRFLRHAAEPATQDRQSNKDGATLLIVNQKEVPMAPTWPATPISTKPAPTSPSENLSSTSSALPVSQKTRTRSTRLPFRFKDFDMKRRLATKFSLGVNKSFCKLKLARFLVKFC